MKLTTQEINSLDNACDSARIGAAGTFRQKKNVSITVFESGEVMVALRKLRKPRGKCLRSWLDACHVRAADSRLIVRRGSRSYGIIFTPAAS